MSTTTALRALVLTGLAATCTLGLAVPAQAASIDVGNGPVTSTSAEETFLAPVGAPREVFFNNPATGTEDFPAGTYWIQYLTASPGTDGFLVEGLTEELGQWRAERHVVTLAEAGPITVPITDTVREARRSHLLNLVEAPSAGRTPRR